VILLWLLPAAAGLHIVEEFLFPGGFGSWYRSYKQSVSTSFTPRYLVMINIILVVLCILPLLMDAMTGIALWLTMASVVFVNALFHVRGSLTSRKYSPGVVTSVLLYIPLSVYGYWYFLTTHQAPIEQGIASFAGGLCYWWLSSINHKRRAKAISRTRQVV
jgi:hypothetical protein